MKTITEHLLQKRKARKFVIIQNIIDSSYFNAFEKIITVGHNLLAKINIFSKTTFGVPHECNEKEPATFLNIYFTQLL